MVYENFVMTAVERAEVEYMNVLKRYGNDGREDVIGDNYLDIKDTRYGNNVLLTSDAALGTMQAGVIGARRGNARGGDGIMDRPGSWPCVLRPVKVNLI